MLTGGAVTDWGQWAREPSGWVDLTRVLDADAPRVPAFPAPAVHRVWSIPAQPANVTEIGMWCHVGTHVDAPLHFLPGAPAAHELPLSRLIGGGVVWRIPAAPGGEIDVAMLAACTPPMRPGDRVLLDARWARRWGTPSYLDNPYLTDAAAAWLVGRGAALVGVDFGTPDLPPGRRPDGFGFPVHHILLGGGVLIVEHLADLRLLSGHRVEVVVAPLPVRGGDGAPCRVVARVADP